jgi:methylated-DNA-[protein]-cysteine S-methyltransferase
MKKERVEILKTLLLLIPAGKVTTYGSLAKVMKTSPRAIGSILSKNKDLVIVPCHRVVMSDRSLGGYSLGRDFKRKLLQLEGVEFDSDKVSKRSLIMLDEIIETV